MSAPRERLSTEEITMQPVQPVLSWSKPIQLLLSKQWSILKMGAAHCRCSLPSTGAAT